MWFEIVLWILFPVVFSGLLVWSLSFTSLFPMTRMYRSRTFLRNRWNNIITQAHMSLLIFDDALGHELFDDPVFLCALEDAFKRGVRVEVLYGPGVTVHRPRLFALLTRFGEHARVRSLDGSHEERFYDAAEKRWRYSHFIVADEKHFTIEDRHDRDETPDHVHSWHEFRNAPEHALVLARHFYGFGQYVA